MKKLMTTLLAAALLLTAGAGCFAESAGTVPAAGDQIALLLDAFGSFTPAAADGTWLLTAADLDHNGRLELLAACTDEAGNCRALLAWEVSEDGKSAEEIKAGLPEGKENPGLTLESAETWHDAEGETWSYLFSSELKLSEQDIYAFRCGVSLQEGALSYTVLPTMHTQTVSGQKTVSLLDAAGAVQALSGSGTPEEDAFAGEKQKDTAFAWLSLPEVNAAACEACYRVFTGEAVKAAGAGSPAPQNGTQSAPQAQQGAAVSPSYPTPTPTLSSDATHDPMYDELFAASQPVYASPAPGAQPTAGPALTHDPLYSPIAPYFPEPTPTPYTKLMVTRNPTDENRRVGSTANFVANANVRDSLWWVFVSPDGGEMSWQDFNSIFPEAQISGVNEGVLSIGNVSEGMNGWGAYCVFTYQDQTVSSGAGYIRIY